MWQFALAGADLAWLTAMITAPPVTFARWTEALVREPDDINVVVDRSGATESASIIGGHGDAGVPRQLLVRLARARVELARGPYRRASKRVGVGGK